MNVETVTAVIVALGGATLIPKLLDWLKATQSGRAQAEKRKNRSILDRVDEAEERAKEADDRADDEANFRRLIEEWAGGLVYLLKQIGVPENQIPRKPERVKVDS